MFVQHRGKMHQTLHWYTSGIAFTLESNMQLVQNIATTAELSNKYSLCTWNIGCNSSKTFLLHLECRLKHGKMSALLSHNLEIQNAVCPDASPVCKILTSTHWMCKIYTAIRRFIQHSMANVASMENNTTNKQTAMNAFITNRFCCLSKLLTIPI